MTSADAGAGRESSAALERVFGHTSFRPGQEEIVGAVLAGHDVLAVMPTGSGKSLGYQLPAILLTGTTLVVSPLIALMKDQVDELNRKGIAAAALHSLLDTDERRGVLAAARRGGLRLLYVAPERFASENFWHLLAELPLSRFAVDEAHCVSEWGHDFRPDYRRLAEAAAACRRGDGGPGRPPIIAFTATATPEVRDDIVELLGLTSPRLFVAGFDRPNLTLVVRPVSGEIEKRRILPKLVGERRALVYAATRKSTERACEALTDAGIDAASYHAGLDETERTRVQDGFAAGSLRVVCATNAFGMGIDRPDVEAVVHFEVPGSLEAYYQEIGRGGRDGRPAVTTLLWNFVDVRIREFLIEKEEAEPDLWDARNPMRPARRGAEPSDPEQRQRKRDLDRRKLRRMIDYASSSACLRATLLGYFGEAGVAPRCGNCGNCARVARLGEAELLTLRKVLSGVARCGERWGKRKVAAMLAGALDGLPESLANLSTTGILAGQPLPLIERWIEAAQAAGLLHATDDVYRTLSLTSSGREAMAGRSTDIELAVPAPAPRPEARTRAKKGKPEKSARLTPSQGAAPEPPPDEALLAKLKEWRRREATERAVPSYVVFHDSTLARIAGTKPGSLDALAAISGIGPAKLEAYGEKLLAIIASGLIGQ